MLPPSRRSTSLSTPPEIVANSATLSGGMEGRVSVGAGGLVSVGAGVSGVPAAGSVLPGRGAGAGAGRGGVGVSGWPAQPVSSTSSAMPIAARYLVTVFVVLPIWVECYHVGTAPSTCDGEIMTKTGFRLRRAFVTRGFITFLSSIAPGAFLFPGGVLILPGSAAGRRE
jgi:hypothetical protein